MQFCNILKKIKGSPALDLWSLATEGTQEGRKLCEPYQNLDGESQLSESIKSFHIGKDLG